MPFRLFSRVKAKDADLDLESVSVSQPVKQETVKVESQDVEKETVKQETVKHEVEHKTQEENQEFQEEVKTFNNIHRDELLIIGSFLRVSDLGNFAATNQQLLELFFNLTIDKVNLIAARKEEFSELGMDSRIVSIKDIYKEDDKLFDATQLIIWKPLVYFHFPNYSKTLNVKNWMHVLRRRFTHLQIHSSEPRDKIVMISNNYENELVEGCEWEYECPLKINSMTPVSDSKVFCNVCKEDVYKVHSTFDLEFHTRQGHCVILTEEDKKPMKIGKTYNPNYLRTEKPGINFL